MKKNRRRFYSFFPIRQKTDGVAVIEKKGVVDKGGTKIFLFFWGGGWVGLGGRLLLKRGKNNKRMAITATVGQDCSSRLFSLWFCGGGGGGVS